MGAVDDLAWSAVLWARQKELVGILLAAGHTPVGDVPAGGVVVVSMVAHLDWGITLSLWSLSAVKC